MSKDKESKSKIACINLGYYQVKASNDVCFKSRAKITIDDKNMSSGDILEYNDKKYILEIGQPVLDGDKTSSELTKVFVLTALAKMNDSEDGEFNVLLTAPPISFEQQSKQLPEFLEGEYSVKLNNKPIEIKINKVVVLPETFLIYTVNSPSKLKNGKTLIIDVGGRTTNICILNNCKFSLEDDYTTIPKGMYHICNSIAQGINKDKFTTYDDEDISGYIETRSKMVDDNIDKFEKGYRDHVEEIAKNIAIKSWQIDQYTNVLVTGGGGMVLEDYIKEELFPNAKLSNEPLWDNLKALEVMAKGVFK